MFEIVPIETPSLGDRSYLVHDRGDALVVDPQRDIDRILGYLQERGLRLRAVFETHLHNDYVTGGHALAQATGATYHVNGDDLVQVPRVALSDGDVIDVTPSLSMQALLTPGHTHTHLSYLLRNNGTIVAAFTGGSLLFGSVGRPDLLGDDSTVELAHAQFTSAHRIAEYAPDFAQVLPTHGFGSFCSASQTEATESTIGAEKASNPALSLDQDAFVRELLAGLDDYPAYYVHMAPINHNPPAGPPDIGSIPTAAGAHELRARIQAGEWVVDLRTRQAYTAGHVPGSLNVGLDGSFVTYLGWTIPWGTPLTLIADDPGQIVDAQRELVRIGIDRVEAAAVGTAEELSAPSLPERIPRVDFAAVPGALAQPRTVVLDVRRRLEWAHGHIAGAIHIPLHELQQRLDHAPTGQLWVHCGTGYRASIAASMLAATGHDVVLIDDDWANAEHAGLTVTCERTGSTA